MVCFVGYQAAFAEKVAIVEDPDLNRISRIAIMQPDEIIFFEPSVRFGGGFYGDGGSCRE